MTTISDLCAAPADLSQWLASLKPPSHSSLNWKPLYLIAMTARSGSTMLCSMIKQSREFGIPDEYFNPRGPFNTHHARYGGNTIQEYLGSIRVHSKSTLVGIKTAFVDFYPVANHFSHALQKYANFVYLTRSDIYAQAVSLWSAKKTNLWHSLDGTKSKIDVCHYNYSEILFALQQLIEEKIKWETYFSFQGILPLRLYYEEICSHPEKTIFALAAFLGVRISLEHIHGIRPETTPLSSDAQKNICARFTGDFGANGDAFKILNTINSKH